MAFNWTCPHCQYPQVGGNENADVFNNGFRIGATNHTGHLGTVTHAVACQNSGCKKIHLTTELTTGNWYQGTWTPSKAEAIQFWTLLPEASGKPQPEYIPQVIRDDYVEACRIRELSPKASATLSRRCIQGMIRDFCGISKATLALEIATLTKLVDEGQEPRGVTPESVQGIDNVRQIGNIGAHMEKDINVIVEIDPEEAQILIELVETLFDEWYVARQQRNQRFAKLSEIKDAKTAKKEAGKSH